MSYGQPPYQPPRGPGQYDPQGFDARYGAPMNPYGQYPPPPRQGGGMWKWLLIFGGVGGVMVLMCCGGCMWLANIGFQEDAHEIQLMIAKHPAVVEHIGEIESMEMNYGASMLHDDDQVYIYDIAGDKGRGRVITRESPGFNMDLSLEWAKLELPNGDEHDLLP